MRIALKENDLRHWQPASPVLLCSGKRSTTVFFNLNTQLMQAFWSVSSPDALPTGWCH